MTESARTTWKWRGFTADSTVSFVLRSLLWLIVVLALIVPLMGLQH